MVIDDNTAMAQDKKEIERGNASTNMKRKVKDSETRNNQEFTAKATMVRGTHFRPGTSPINH